MTHQNLSLGMCLSKPSCTRVPKTWRLCMAYWPSVRSRWLDIGQVLFLGVFMDRDEFEVHKHAKKRTSPISSHLDRTNLVNKGFIIWLLVKFCLRDTAGSPERARWLHLARSGSQSQRTIWFILHARGASHLIMSDTVYRVLRLCMLFHLSSACSQIKKWDVAF